MNIENYRLKREALLKKHGWFVQAVMSEPDVGEIGIPGYSYTVGLVSMGMSDLLLLGTSAETAQAILHLIVQKMKDKRIQGQDKEVVTEAANFPVYLKSTTPQALEHFALGAFTHAHKSNLDPKLLQVVFPDSNGLYPWQDGCDEEIRYLQDIPGLVALLQQERGTDDSAAPGHHLH